MKLLLVGALPIPIGDGYPRVVQLGPRTWERCHCEVEEITRPGTIVSSWASTSPPPARAVASRFWSVFWLVDGEVTRRQCNSSGASSPGYVAARRRRAQSEKELLLLDRGALVALAVLLGSAAQSLSTPSRPRGARPWPRQPRCCPSARSALLRRPEQNLEQLADLSPLDKGGRRGGSGLTW